MPHKIRVQSASGQKRVTLDSAENTLADLQKQIEKLPDVPQKGDFNIEEVMHSEFFFA